MVLQSEIHEPRSMKFHRIGWELDHHSTMATFKVKLGQEASMGFATTPSTIWCSIVMHLQVGPIADNPVPRIVPKLQAYFGDEVVQKHNEFKNEGSDFYHPLFIYNTSIHSLLSSYLMCIDNYGRYSMIFNNCQTFCNDLEVLLMKQADQTFDNGEFGSFDQVRIRNNQNYLRRRRANPLITSVLNHRGFEESFQIMQKQHDNQWVDFFRKRTGRSEMRMINIHGISVPLRAAITALLVLGLVFGFCIWCLYGNWTIMVFFTITILLIK